MKLFDIAKIKKSKWLELGGKLVTRIVEDADNGISQDGSGNSRDFASYSPEYAFKKSKGKATRKGVSSSRQTSPPNLRLTGTMLNSIKAQRATTNSVELNFRDGLKVIGHSRKRGNKPKRNIYGLNAKNENFANNFIEDEINSNIFKFNRKSIKIDLKI